MKARAIRGPRELTRCLQIRREVFIDEQGVAKALELDGLEGECTHFLAWKEAEQEVAQALGAARLRIEPDGTAMAQRVAVLRVARGLGVGRALMHAIEQQALRLGLPCLVLGAQQTAIPFYVALGYTAFGAEFDDAGIPHRMMRRALT